MAQELVSKTPKRAGLRRVLITTYIILALAASGRSLYQVLRKFEQAPLAYSLSVLAAVVYVLATVALIRNGKKWRIIAWLALGFELAGVLTVGTLSLIAPQLFAHPSVWSHFGSGYLFIPLLLPILGMLWLKSGAKAQPELQNA